VGGPSSHGTRAFSPGRDGTSNGLHAAADARTISAALMIRTTARPADSRPLCRRNHVGNITLGLIVGISRLLP